MDRAAAPGWRRVQFDPRAAAGFRARFRLLPCLWPRADHAACRALHYGPHAGVPAAPVPETETGPAGPVGPYPCGPASVALCNAQDLARKSVGWGKRVSVRVEPGGRRI